MYMMLFLYVDFLIDVWIGSNLSNISGLKYIDIDGITQADGGLVIPLPYNQYMPVFITPLSTNSEMLYTVNILDAGGRWYTNFKQYQTGEYINQKQVKARVWYLPR